MASKQADLMPCVTSLTLSWQSKPLSREPQRRLDKMAGPRRGPNDPRA